MFFWGKKDKDTLKLTQRKKQSLKLIAREGITFDKSLPCLFEDSKVQLKSIDDISKMALMSGIIAQLGFIAKANVDSASANKARATVIEKIKIFGIEDCIGAKEKRIIEGNCSEQDIIDANWYFESAWALCWCLGLVDDIKNGGVVCEASKVIAMANRCRNLEEFKSECCLRSKEDILNMHDLYYRYYWAVDKNWNDKVFKTGSLNSSIVIERRKALEWVLSDVKFFDELKL
ncbi:MAG: DUF4272 domain-containing protein [Clostridia bacterium]|nr:DUF4272 domain-containing protein [Clostridia bacterium]